MGKKKVKSDWTHDGGMELDNAGAPEGRRSGPRMTQDRDERFRRGRLKMADAKQKRTFAKKMANKVHFFDVLEKKVVEEEALPAQKRIRTTSRHKSSLSVMQRFQNFLHQSRGAEGAKGGEDDDEEDEGDEYEDKEDEKGEEDMEDDEIDDAHDMGQENDEEEEEDDEQAQDGDGGDDGASSSSFQWFFDSESSEVARGNSKFVGEFDGFSLHRWWNESANFTANPWKTLGDISTIPKLWRSRTSEKLDAMAKVLLPYLSTYCDTILDGRDNTCDDAMLTPILLHACMHVFRARTKVIKHNTKIKKKMTEMSLKNEGGGEDRKKKKDAAADLPGGAHQDQGFARPRILILCPFRGVALKCIENMLQIYGDNTSVANLDKFRKEYGFDDEDEEDEDDEDDDEDEEDDEDVGGNNDQITEKSKKRKAKKKAKRRLPKGDAGKPEDWKADFRQNIDDDFKIGVQINPGHGKGSGADKGVYVRLYSDFFISDIIVASPLGLRFIIENGPKDSADFLSSIEMVVLHQADILYMQNWDHVEYVLKHTNKMPTTNNEIDFSRVRPYFLDGHASKHRQLIITSHFNEPPIQACFRSFGQSIAGVCRFGKKWKDGVLSNVVARACNQVFQRVQANELARQEDERFNYFKEIVLGPLLRTNQKRTIIVTPSYISYVRVRNELMRQEANAVFVCEYSRVSEVSRGRSRFFHGTKDILLYSGRFHYFSRYLVRGANHVVFYSLPEYPHFYPEIVNTLTDTGEASASSASSCLVLFTRYEQMALERIVGNKWAKHLLNSEKQTFLFKA
jgi:U3 small nucleolar RNA-associated protein 25